MYNKVWNPKNIYNSSIKYFNYVYFILYKNDVVHFLTTFTYSQKIVKIKVINVLCEQENTICA